MIVGLSLEGGVGWAAYHASTITTTDTMNTFDVVLLIGSGVLVGFINTLAGGGTIISLSVFMMLGLPPITANGTHRIAATLQTMTS
ncbi:MAG: hypothetical protein CVU06_09250, partial [Bacteroidetes bacterium HGW-Bacteroidetes-22]